MTTKQIEKKMGDEFMTVILSYGKLESSLRDVTRMMQNKKFADADIKAYVASLVEEAMTSTMKELNK
jgi:hypothetical protein